MTYEVRKGWEFGGFLIGTAYNEPMAAALAKAAVHNGCYEVTVWCDHKRAATFSERGLQPAFGKVA